MFVLAGGWLKAQPPALNDHYLFNQSWRYDAQDYAALPWMFYYANVATPLPAGTRRTRCAFTQVDGAPYGRASFDWFNYPDYSPADGANPFAPPGEYIATRTKSASLTGFDFEGESGGVPLAPTKAGFFVEAVYFTDRECSDGGTEYGWYRLPAQAGADQPANSVNFYYSTFTNCNLDFMCWDTDGKQVLSQVATVTIANLPFNSSGSLEYEFRAIRSGASFHLTLLDAATGAIATGCSAIGTVDVSQTGTSCDFAVTIANWYSSEAVTQSGYIVSATQSSRTIPPPPDFPALGALTVKSVHEWTN